MPTPQRNASKRTLHVQLPTAMYYKLHHYCKETGISKRSFVISSIDQFLKLVKKGCQDE